jgi:endonuclease/exonuclease/phosphatase family metal-dependent hydrolase
VRILTYNIHKGFCFYSRRYVLDELREAIRSTTADIVFLQEVKGLHASASQFEFLADQIWSHYAYGKNAAYEDGHHGNAILSKRPIERWENLDISTNSWEKRGLLHVELDGLHLICLHLDLFERGRVQQMRNVADRIQKHVPPKAPLILAGDFNDWRGRLSPFLINDLGMTECGQVQHQRLQATFPSWHPFLPLDRVYTRGFNTLSHRVLKDGVWKRLSDHAAVVVDLEEQAP